MLVIYVWFILNWKECSSFYLKNELYVSLQFHLVSENNKLSKIDVLTVVCDPLATLCNA